MTEEEMDKLLQQVDAETRTKTAVLAVPATCDLRIVERARAYISKMPPAISGSGGHNSTLAVARVLVNDFSLDESAALALLCEYSSKCSPPWSDRELEHKVRQAVKLSESGRCDNPRGHLLADSAPSFTIRRVPDVQKNGVAKAESQTHSNAALASWRNGIGKPMTKPTEPETPENLDGLSFSDLLNYDTKHDPNCLIGNRWLCRGGSVGIVGPTGAGKSSIAMQFAITMGLGRSFFGMKPVRPLKSCIIQAENDTGDLAEEIQGILAGLDLARERDSLESQVRLFCECGKIGAEFGEFAQRIVEKHKPDMVVVDPWFAFLGGDVSDQKTVSLFLRGMLNPIAQATGVAWVIIHHINKPQAKTGGRQPQGGESYLGSGSAEFANWSRAVLALKETGENAFELTAAKRGKRAGFTLADEGPVIKVNSVKLRHSDRGICWQRRADDAPESCDGEEAANVIALKQKFPAEGLAWKELIEFIKKEMACGRTKAIDLYNQHLKGKHFSQISGRYFALNFKVKLAGSPD